MAENIAEEEQCHILDLNDDCFFEIYKYLPVIDWCVLRETCTRLQSISDVCFQRQHKLLELKGKFIYDSEYETLSMVDVKRLIRNFGRFISKLTINSKSFGPREDYSKFVPLLHRYCNELQDLKLVNIDFDSEIAERCQSLFSNLHRLVIDQSIHDEMTISTCLSHCGSLKELELIRLENIDVRCLANNFKALESFSINSCNDFTYDYIREFFVKNSQLKTLKILRSNFKNDTTTIQVFQDLCNNLENLEELSLHFDPFQVYDANMVPIMRLKKLKKFEIDGGHVGVGINPLLIRLVAHKTIENLHVASVVMNDPEITRTLCEFKTMKILKFTAVNGLDGDIYKKLASELPALIEIQIIECANSKFSDLEAFVQHSSNLKKIVFKRFEEKPSFTQDVFSALIETQQRKESEEALTIHLTNDDIYDIKDDFMYAESSMLVEQAHIIKLLPLDEDTIKAVHEFGSGFRRPPRIDGVFGFDNFDDMDDDMLDNADYDDDFDDVDDDFF